MFLLIPLFYPPVSTTLKSYVTNIVNFYDQLFQQFTGPAHSRDTQEVAVPQSKKTVSDSSSLDDEHPNVESRAATKDMSEVLQPLESRSESVPKSVEKTIDLKDFKLVIPFDYNSNEVPESAYTDLNRVAAATFRDPKVIIVVRGYTDNKGSNTYNRQLSAFRANIVKSYLVGRGIGPERVKAMGMGEEDPLKPNTSAEGQSANRRVEIQLIEDSSKL